MMLKLEFFPRVLSKIVDPVQPLEYETGLLGFTIQIALHFDSFPQPVLL